MPRSYGLLLFNFSPSEAVFCFKLYFLPPSSPQERDEHLNNLFFSLSSFYPPVYSYDLYQNVLYDLKIINKIKNRPFDRKERRKCHLFSLSYKKSILAAMCWHFTGV